MALRAFPALSEHRNLRFATVSLLYVAQGLPYGLFTFSIPAWLAEQGATTAQVATFAAISFLPWGFKWLVAPFMDSFSFPAMGRRRPWILGAQIGLVLALVALATAPDPIANLGILAALAFCVSTFAATQDVAVDGMTIDILPEDERARANAFMFGAQVFGIFVGTTGGAYALSALGLYAAALGACKALTVLWYAKRKGIEVQDLEVTVERDDGTATERLQFYGAEVSADFFKAMGTPLLEGRFFSIADGPEAPPVAIINEVMARRSWPAPS